MVLGESAFFVPDGHGGMRPGFDQVLSKLPSPEFVTQLTDEFERLFAQLTDADQRTIATLKMEGHTIDEISLRVGRAPATIERKWKVIRALWEKDLL